MGAVQKFFEQRSVPLDKKFKGLQRAVVVETNDPLCMRRVRFKNPDMHDWDLKPEMCPWAVPAEDLGTKGCGRFSYPCIGDWVWIDFEKGHPYAPVYVGFADPTRRRFYPLSSIYIPTPIPIDKLSTSTAVIGPSFEQGEPATDYYDAYLPKDGRPMSHGWQDRYGNLDVHSAVGFFPIEHTVSPPPPDSDQLTKSKFQQATNTPESNNPDSKMMARISKYGMLILQADMGYRWYKGGGKLDTESIEGEREVEEGDGGSDDGEFTGDFDEDKDFEIERWKYYQRLIHEDSPANHDQRRLMMLTRYGHKFEMRDVGWYKTREGEWGNNKRNIGDPDADDNRWIKLRTKGGHLFQMSDIGFDPEEDEWIKRPLISEIGSLDKEEDFEEDARFIRWVTRSGIKFVLDDRTSDDKKAQNANLANADIGIGMLIKGRASPGTKKTYENASGNSIGYYMQFDERPGHNSTAWGTPLGQVIGMDDNEQYAIICSRLPDLPTKWEGLSNNEFLESAIKSYNPSKVTHHLILDHGSESIRFKSRAGQGNIKSDLVESATGQHAGIEVRDAPKDNPWTELVDIDDRGIWFSRKYGIGIWRGKNKSDIHICLDDTDNNISIYNNNSNGNVQIYCAGQVDVKGGSINFEAANINFKANEITMLNRDSTTRFNGTGMQTTSDIGARNVRAYLPEVEKPIDTNGTGVGKPAPGNAASISNLKIEQPNKIKPDNRISDDN